MSDCLISHVPGSQTERMCPTHGINVRRGDVDLASVAIAAMPRSYVSAPGDSVSDSLAMRRSNGLVTPDGAEAGLLPLCDRHVILRRALNGGWAVDLVGLDARVPTAETGLGRTPTEAFHAALRERFGHFSSDAAFALLRIDAWASGVTSPPGEIRVLVVEPAARDDETFLAAAIEDVERQAGAGVVRFRIWICERERLREVSGAER